MTEDSWKKKLSPEQYHVLREKGTEKPFTGKYHNNHEKGMYFCAACGQELFSSDTKFDSGTGWPSFTQPVNLKNVELKDDLSYGMKRTKVVCRKCGSHLGHLFNDLPRFASKAGGPKSMPDGQPASGNRFCINSCALDFKKEN